MYVCVCKAITTNDLQAAIRKGHKTLPSLQECTGLGSGCGRCREFTLSLLEDVSDSES
jgi:bacterioferritin-associated ferredoxin